MRTLLQALVRLRNPRFTFSDQIPMSWLWSLGWSKAWALMRGMLIFYRPWVFAGKGVATFAKGRIFLGRMAQIGDHVYLSGLGQDGLWIGESSSIGAFSRLVVSTTFSEPGACIRIGRNVGIGEFAYLGGAGGLEIGDGCIIGQYFSCHPESHNFGDPTQEIRHQGTTRQGIHIGPNCWIGAKVTICDGVTIGEGCVIAAGAVVTRSVPPHCVVGGVPARVLKSTLTSRNDAMATAVTA